MLGFRCHHPSIFFKSSTADIISSYLYPVITRRCASTWRVYNPKEDAMIVEMRDAGHSFASIGLSIARPRQSVWRRYNHLLQRTAGNLIPSNKSWSAEESELPVRRLNHGANHTSIAQELKRDEQVVLTRRIRWRRGRELRNKGRYTREETDTIRRWKNERVPHPGIARRLGHPLSWSSWTRLLGRDRQLVEMRQDNLPWDTIVQKLQRAQAVCDHRLRYLRKKGNVTFAPSTSYWTAEKDRELTRYRSELRLSWRQIAEHFPGWSPAYLGQRFRNIKRPKIYYRPWTTEENEKLKHLCSGLQLSWEQIAEHFPGRTVGAVARQFRRCSDGCNYWTAEEEAEVIRLRSELQLSWKEIAERLGRTTFAIQVRCVKLDAKVRPCTYGWTAEQDRELIRLRTELGLPWDQIAERMPGRSPATIHKRCVKLGVRHYWSAEEDRELMRLHSELRLPWKQIAERFPHRTITVIKKRAQVLSRKLRTRIWTPEEDRELLRLHSELQLDWRQIAERFPGRTARAVEQRGSKVLGVRWSGNPSWDAERERELIRLRSELKLPWAQVTERIGGSIASVSHRFYKLQKHIGVAS